MNTYVQCALAEIVADQDGIDDYNGAKGLLVRKVADCEVLMCVMSLLASSLTATHHLISPMIRFLSFRVVVSNDAYGMLLP